ncbi:MAG: hypothetical protein H0X24_16405, partial [Ktedonobacterales bacterium]|nr:hypothetical protein [Ktedonobacterales bacterium]
MPFHGIKAAAPSRKHLRHWQRVCLYLDSQPFRSVRFPFPDDPPMSSRLLRRMQTFKLVRHCHTDCTYRLAVRWRSLFQRLWDGADDEETVVDAVPNLIGDPFIVDANVDTMYVSLLAPESEGDETLDKLRLLPAHLNDVCGRLKEQAQAEDKAVETPWHLFDTSLMMYKAGIGTKGDGKGVSWSYLLRNAYVMLRFRKTPLGQLLGSFRLSAECLWTYGPQVALDGVRQLLRQMWNDDEAFYGLTFRLSQLHLCVDVANFVPSPADLDRVLTRSRVKGIHVPSVSDESAEFAVMGTFDDYLSGQPDEWDDLDPAFFADDGDPDAFVADAEDDEDSDEGDETPADEEGAAVYLFGPRASGFAFSPGAPLSAAWYNKELEERLSGKSWMRVVHQAGGWTPDMPLFRVELRFMRPVMREMQTYLGKEAGAWLDDPWQAIEHYGDFWGYGVGLPPEHDHAPDVTHRGWMRLTIPSEDSNRSRWPTDPAWEVIQRADFGSYAPPMPLLRKKAVVHNP